MAVFSCLVLDARLQLSTVMLKPLPTLYYRKLLLIEVGEDQSTVFLAIATLILNCSVNFVLHPLRCFSLSVVTVNCRCFDSCFFCFEVGTSQSRTYAFNHQYYHLCELDDPSV